LLFLLFLQYPSIYSFLSISSQKGDYNRTQIVPEREEKKELKRIHKAKDAGKKMMPMLLIGGCRVALGTTKTLKKDLKIKNEDEVENFSHLSHL
jgi:hypothetical protein